MARVYRFKPSRNLSLAVHIYWFCCGKFCSQVVVLLWKILVVIHKMFIKAALHLPRHHLIYRQTFIFLFPSLLGICLVPVQKSFFFFFFFFLQFTLGPGKMSYFQQLTRVFVFFFLQFFLEFGQAFSYNHLLYDDIRRI